MFQVEIDGRKVDAEVTFYTAWLYEAEFASDMLKDFYGKQDGSPDIVTDATGEQILSVDFTHVNWLAITKALWAAIKTADKALPGYSAWMKENKGMNSWIVREQVGEAINDCFFRA